MRYEDGDVQPGQYLNNDLKWTKPESNPENINQRLAKKLTQEPIINPSKNCEIIKTPKKKVFSKVIIIKLKSIVEKEAKNIYKPKKANLNLIIWLDKSKLETENVETGITLK